MQETLDLNCNNDDHLPLKGIRVLDFAQFLAGPVAAMRLADLGADVIKIERPEVGDACRSLVINDQRIGENSLLFHTFNRNKRSFAADLKSDTDLQDVKALVRTADVVIHNFRPGIMEKLGLDFPSLKQINPGLIYGAVSGYGNKGPWRQKPGQDLLAQCMSGMAWLSGDEPDGPVPIGFPLIDIATAGNLVQGILAVLLRKARTGQGGLVEVDLMSSAVDLQIEHLGAYLNGDRTLPRRSTIGNANVYGAAPYGVYKLRGGYLAIAMTPLKQLEELLAIPALGGFLQDKAFACRDEIKSLIAANLANRQLEEVLNALESAGVWCAKVMDWNEFTASAGFEALSPTHTVVTSQGRELIATRAPLRLDGKTLMTNKGAPELGENTHELKAELRLSSTG